MNQVIKGNISERKSSIFNIEILYIFLLLPFFELIYTEYDLFIYKIYVAWKIISTIIVIFLTINFNKRPSIFFKLILLSNLVLFFSTYINGGNFFRFFSFAIESINVFLLIELYIKYNHRLALRGISKIVSILGFLNLIFLILYPDGIYIGYSMDTPIRYNLLGLDNQMSAIFIPGLFFLYIKDLIFYNKIKSLTWIPIIILISNILYVQTITGIIGVIIFIFYHFRKLFPLKLKPKYYFILILIIFFGIIIFRFQEIFSFIIEDIFNKSINFSDRTILWDGALEMLNKNLIYGNGIQDSEELILWASNIYKNPHNLILNFLILGGLLMTSIYILMIYLSLKYLNSNISIVSKTVSLAIFTFLMMSLVEVYYNLTLFYALLIFSLTLKKINK